MLRLGYLIENTQAAASFVFETLRGETAFLAAVTLNRHPDAKRFIAENAQWLIEPLRRRGLTSEGLEPLGGVSSTISASIADEQIA
ncbi:MAG: hypothetical protein JNJ49_08245 [Bdellovibrionaceae bacterium]|nr:hypothetical protein [Pseudobdellovibrionaceae bacterium]